jgi:hypothetical protein
MSFMNKDKSTKVREREKKVLNLSLDDEDATNKMMESFFSINDTGDFLKANYDTALTIQPQLNLSQPAVRKVGEEREICVARFGRIYKRKVPSGIGYLARPSLPGYRFCKVCNATLPLSAFYTTVKRYMCKRHHYLRVNKTFKIRMRLNSMDRYSFKTWLKLSANRFDLGYDKIRFDCSDIKAMIEKSGVPRDVNPSAIPIDPMLPLRPRNVAIVSSQAYTLALNIYQFTCSRALYIGFIQRSNLLPINFDVARLDDPYHDPTYKREFYDFAEMLKEELAAPTIESEDRVILEEIDKKEDVPWITCEALADNVGGFCRDSQSWKVNSGVDTNNKVQGSI